MPEVTATEGGGTPGVADAGLDASLFAGHGIVRIHEMHPAELWNAISPNTRRWWLDIAGQPLGYRLDRWDAIPTNIRKRLQLTMQFIMVMLTGAGLDLSGLRK